MCLYYIVVISFKNKQTSMLKKMKGPFHGRAVFNSIKVINKPIHDALGLLSITKILNN